MSTSGSGAAAGRWAENPDNTSGCWLPEHRSLTVAALILRTNPRLSERFPYTSECHPLHNTKQRGKTGRQRNVIPQSVSIKKLAHAVWWESRADNVFGLAGQMSYFFSLALFPFLIFLAALAGSLPV